MILLALLFATNVSFAKDLNGDPFMIPSGSLYPEESARFNQLNSLHTWSVASLKGPFYKWQIQSPKDDFKKLLDVFPDNLYYKINIFELEAAGLSTGKTNHSFWSYHYFPVYKGGVAQRFLSPVFVGEEDWNNLYQEYQKNPPGKLIDENSSSILSPIEKYEYLIGNENFSLTSKQWAEGLLAQRRYGIIPTWYGSCHGTAPASIRQARAEKAITVRSFDNRNDIIFYPSDIKALLSYAWATTGGESAMIGTRCDEVIQNQGRPSPACNDVNPGAFHLAITNLVGLHHEPIIIDTAESIQVWNRPLLSYRLNYYHPATRNLTQNLKSAMVPREKFITDPYKQYRSPQTAFIVGVWIELFFGAGVPASDATTNSAADDAFVTTNYWYDLELDSKGDIIGGEWHEIFHPDFVWVVSPEAKPRTIYDHLMGSGLLSYDGKKPLPGQVTDLAKKSSVSGELLFSIVEKMLHLSRQ